MKNIKKNIGFTIMLRKTKKIIYGCTAASDKKDVERFLSKLGFNNKNSVIVVG